MPQSSIPIPETGLNRTSVLEQMREFHQQDVNWEQNRAFGLVYHFSDEHSDFIKKAYNEFSSTNGLNPMAFRSLKKMEHEVVRMTADMFHGDDTVVGTMSSGGTESLLLAVLAYREYARHKRPWIRKPETIVPESAHAAFFKGGGYFDVKIVESPLGKQFSADVAAMEKLITRNTVALVASAPCYPYGTMDPIPAIAELARKNNLPLHVDACIGGFLVPWIEKLPKERWLTNIEPFDFRVPGVTSISADVHKYGYAAKGASTILYRGMEYLRCQFSASTDWCGGVYASPTLAGTRPGGTISAAWASMMALGKDGYMGNAGRLVDVTARFMKGIRAIPELEVLGNPVMAILAFAAKDRRFSVYAVGDYLEEKGWHIDRIQRPEALHLIINPGHAQICDQFLQDLRDGVEYVRKHPDAAFEGSAPMYGLIAKAPMRKLVKRQVLALMEGMYGAEGRMPDLGKTPELGESADEKAPSGGGVPPIVLKLMKAQAKIRNLFSRGKE